MYVSKEDRNTIVNLVRDIKQNYNGNNLKDVVGDVFFEQGLSLILLLKGWKSEDIMCLVGCVAIVLNMDISENSTNKFDIACGSEFTEELINSLNVILNFVRTKSNV